MRRGLLAFATAAMVVTSAAGSGPPRPGPSGSPGIAGTYATSPRSRDPVPTGHWYCAEISSVEAFGYGSYRFDVTGRPAGLDPNVVLGSFTWDSHGGEHHREIDVQLSRWGDPGSANAHSSAAVPDMGNIHRFDIAGRAHIVLSGFSFVPVTGA